MPVRAFTAAVLLLLTGCSSVPTGAGAPTPAESEPPVPPQSESVPDDSDQMGSLDSCTQQQRSGAQETVVNQTDALRQGDFEEAYSYASPGFQSGVTLEQFSALILASYQPLLVDATLEFGECLVRDGAAQLVIDVVLRGSSENSLGLRYILVDTDRGWSVDGASNFAVGGQAT